MIESEGAGMFADSANFESVGKSTSLIEMSLFRIQSSASSITLHF